MMSGAHAQYQSYLLRLWRSGPCGPWHGSLHRTANEEKHTFADLPTLLAFLVAQLTTEGDAGDLTPLVAWLATQPKRVASSDQ